MTLKAGNIEAGEKCQQFSFRFTAVHTQKLKGCEYFRGDSGLFECVFFFYRGSLDGCMVQCVFSGAAVRAGRAAMFRNMCWLFLSEGV